MFKGLSHSGAEVSHLKRKDGVNAVNPSEALKRGRALKHGTIITNNNNKNLVSYLPGGMLATK